MQSLDEPDARQTADAERRVSELDSALGKALARLDEIQAEAAALDTRRTAAAEALSVASREQTAADAQLATLLQVQRAADENAPLDDWLNRRGLGALPRLWQKIRIDHGWETAVEAVLRERLHALRVGDLGELGSLGADRPPVKA
ncbi:MAG: chromosome segregation protein SMC, partial [Betaproteobacteria bacterium]|nr:chromosome segregation protein SMC [Betaproteobacteria bacterium]